MREAFYAALVDRLVRGLRPLGAREHLQIGELLQSPAAANPAELTAALASLLARNQDEWVTVERCAREALMVRALAGDLPRPRPPLDPRWGAALLALVLAVAGGLIVPRLMRVPKVQSPAQDGTDGTADSDKPPPPPPPPPESFAVNRLADPWEQTRQVLGPQVATARDWWPVCLGAIGLWLLGLRLWLLPRGIVAARRKRADALRERWTQAQMASGAPPLLPYRVQVEPPLPAQAIEDAARYLGRLHRHEGRGALDVVRTLTRTIAAGGRLSPVWAAPLRPRTLLVLVDQAESPYLGGFLRIVERWRRLGVPLLQQRLPASAAALAELGRRHGGAALLVFSAGLSMDGLVPGAPPPLIAAAGEGVFWPRAWLDPDPRTEGERDPVERRHLRGIAQWLPRFPLSATGLVQLARHLSGEVLPGAPTWEPLPPLAAVEGAVRRWAQLAALVPDPTWDQVEWLRQTMPSLQGLDRAGYVRRLLEWLERFGVDRPGQGARLLLDRAQADALRQELRREDEGGQPRRAGAEEMRVRRGLLQQMEGAAPQDELLQELLRVKRAIHGAVVEPERADEMLLPVVDSPLYELVEPEVEQGPGEVARRVQGGAVLSLRELWSVPWQGWSRLGWATGLVVVVGLLAPILPLRSMRRPAATERRVFAEVDELVRMERKKSMVNGKGVVGQWPRTANRAVMVRIKAGWFLMGSPKEEEGRDDDEVLHPVELTRDFAMGATEVTQAQYRKLMGNNPSLFNGDSLPVSNVTWFDALRYCNKLSAAEKLSPCYEFQGVDQVMWRKGLDCEGYRLPTEAEWEYAARAGGRTLYSGSDRFDEVAWHVHNAWGGRNPVKSLKGNAWGLYDMSGNVWEWVWDFFAPYGSNTDPVGPPLGLLRVYRGGAWGLGSLYLRVAYRGWGSPHYAHEALGFRISRTLTTNPGP